MMTSKLGLKIIDFSVSVELDSPYEEEMRLFSSSRVYQAPEAWNEPKVLTKAYDIWSMGLILYQMVYGKLPFATRDIIQLKNDILHQE